MKSAKLFQRWQRRRRQLLDHLAKLDEACRNEGTPRQVHELRVTLRRSRLMVRLGKGVLDRRSASDFRDWARATARLTSRVRDLDTAAELLERCGARRDTVATCRQEREKLWATARAELRPLPRSTVETLRKGEAGPRQREAFAKRAAKTEARLERNIKVLAARIELLTDDESHDLRRRVRWWRYLREIAVGRRKQRTDLLLKALIAVQEAVGNQRNDLIARKEANALAGAGPASPPSAAVGDPDHPERIRGALSALAHQRGWKRLARKFAARESVRQSHRQRGERSVNCAGAHEGTLP